MNRALIFVILIVVIGGGYYFYSQGDGTGEMMETASQAPQAASDAMSGALLTPEGYDAGKVTSMIDASNLDANMKDGLKTALQSAADDPALLQDVLSQVKVALGM